MTMNAKLLVVLVGLALLSCGSAMALTPSIQIGDCVWYDANRDGKFIDPDGTVQPGEYGINEVRVVLTYKDATGTTVTVETKTGTSLYPTSQPFSEGWYNFGSLAVGTEYTVTVTPPAGHVQTYDLVGSQTDNTATVTLAKTRTDVDFGYVLPPAPPVYKVGDRVWNDADMDTEQDLDEAGINGATVRLLDAAGNVFAETETRTVDGVVGYYLFTGVPEGDYSIEVSGTPTGWVCTYDLQGDKDSDSGIFTLSADRDDVDFGYVGVPGTGYCTFTQGGWGAKPSGNNPGALLDKWFYTIYANGLTVGDTYTPDEGPGTPGRLTIKFSTREEITNFLPQGGTAASLTNNYPLIVDGKTVWPKKTEAGVLAGQVVALKLNLDFSNAGVTQFGLGSRIIQYGTFSWNVSNFLKQAEIVLGGGTSEYFSIQEINYIATEINESFDNGTTNTGFLK